MKTCVISVLLMVQVIGTEYVEDTSVREAISFLGACGSTELTLCLKETALSYIRALPSHLEIGGGLCLRPTEGGIDRSPRYNDIPVLPEEPKAREAVVDNILAEKLLNYTASHTIEFKVPENTLNDLRESLEEGRKKKKKRNSLMPLLILIKLKVAALTAVALKTLAVVSFKALLVSKIAIIILLIVGLKKFAETKHSSTYEILARDDHINHYRSLPAQDLAYGSYKHDSNVNV